MADELKAGHLLIVGGGLRPDNAAVYDRLIQYAGGKERARFGILPTASLSTSDARQSKLILVRMGVPEKQVHVIDITPANAERQSYNPAIVELIRSCTGFFIEGGDQTRVMRALRKVDGSETPALTALREAWQGGAVVAGSSAGAAVQCDAMISVAGLPDDSIDEGMDALNFGLTTNRFHRGLFVSRGLAFFQAGIIDQHFSQYRGRLGRLARVTTEKRIPFGFGIDENTALDVAPDGSIEVVGAGTVTVVDSRNAQLEDGPLGCRLSGVRLSCLQAGDRFDSKTGQGTARVGKKPMVRGKEQFNGNFLIPDISGPAAALNGIIEGLADNTATKQVGITLRHNQHYAFGYRFTFHKTEQTQSFEGYVDNLYSYTVLGVRLDIAPVLGTLDIPEKRLPKDLPKAGAMRTMLSAIYHRGILLTDEDGLFRPEADMTRAELAGAIAQTLRLEPPRLGAPQVNDISEDNPYADDIALVVGAKLMELDRDGRFQPTKTVSRQEGATILMRLAERYRSEPLPADIVDLGDASQGDRLTRGMTAATIFKIIGFSWASKVAK